eukprot:10829974-Ditylum_brightwellii.AAC.1
MFGDNETAVNTAFIPHGKLNKRHIAVTYHFVREAIAAVQQHVKKGYNWLCLAEYCLSCIVICLFATLVESQWTAVCQLVTFTPVGNSDEAGCDISRCPER